MKITTSFFTSLATIIFLLSGTAKASEVGLGSNKQATINLLLVCDRNFVLQFNTNMQKIYEYWYTQMWEVNARFKSLAKTSIQVQVVEVATLQDPSEQFSTANFTEKIITFSEWLYKRVGTSIRFDMAILVIGMENNLRTGIWSNTGKICQMNHVEKRYLSFAVLKFHRENQFFSLLVAQSIADLLGYPIDEKATKSCGNNVLYLLSGGPFTKGRFFYSQCADETIFRGLEKGKNQCVFDPDPDAIDVLANYSYAVPPSLMRQCKAIAKHDDAFVGDDPNPCVANNCYIFIFSFGVSSYGKSLEGQVAPLDNTPCAAKSNCFRGQCLEKGYQIQHVKSETCLRSSNWFVSNDAAVAAPCQRVATPLETLRIEKKGKLGKRLLALYSHPYTTKMLNKCLTLNRKTGEVNFKTCENAPDELWRLMRIAVKEPVFLLMHVFTNMCLHVQENDSLKAGTVCNLTDSKLWWRFYDRELSKNVINGLVDGDKNKEEKSCESSWVWGLFKSLF